MDLAKGTCFKLRVAIMTVGPNRVCNYCATVLPARNSQTLATAGENVGAARGTRARGPGPGVPRTSHSGRALACLSLVNQGCPGPDSVY